MWSDVTLVLIVSKPLHAPRSASVLKALLDVSIRTHTKREQSISIGIYTYVVVDTSIGTSESNFK